jgi:FixJ family two-component response regulator
MAGRNVPTAAQLPTKSIMSSPTVCIVDDDGAVRDSLAALLESVGYVTMAYGSGTEFLAAYDAERPGCVVLDVRLPGLSGIEVAAQLASLDLAPPIIMMSGFADVSIVVSAFRAGVLEFLEKPFGDHVFLDCVARAMRVDAVTRAATLDIRTARRRLACLTARERSVLDALVSGKLNKMIASDLSVSERTVEFHRANLMRKLAVETFADLIALAFRAQTSPAVRRPLNGNSVSDESIGRQRAAPPQLRAGGRA